MYNHNLIEKKWQKFWEENKTYHFKNDDKKKKFYVLDMFPYPSGQGLHVGHPKGYTATDIIARYKVHCGFNVLHPIGWDAFGLPAEQYAIQTGNHPKEFTEKNINHFREQLKKIGFSYNYEKEINTSKPEYYKWTQWIFAQLFKHNLAEIREIDVNWCEELGTVLSNEEVLVKDNKLVSERGNFPVIKKSMRQWVLKITKYADKLLEGLDETQWPESLKSIQKKWIGKSEGAIIKFKFNKINLEAFTTRPDTIFGCSFLAISPESEYAKKICSSKETKKQLEQYLEKTKQISDLDRKINKDKTGFFTGVYVKHPISNEQIPIYVSNYVLSSYGTGCVIGVPAHDKRDYEFAKKFNLPIKFIIQTNNTDLPYEGDGKHINSSFLDGLDNKNATKKILDYLSKHKIGKKFITYKLKDWLFSRQRYWGEPFPIVYDEKNKPHLIEKYPLVLPDLDSFKPNKDGLPPLGNLKTWRKVKIGKKEFTRELNTMPQWAGSCWYYLAYLLVKENGELMDLNSSKAFDLFQRWLPVDLYIGGQEHAVLHLLYARFWHRFLYDIKIVPTKEPFYKVINQGMILGENNEKMSKSRGNVVNPDEIVNSHGADALRLYEMFMGPFNASLPWNTTGLNGIRKWLDRVFNLFNSIEVTEKNTNQELEYQYHLFVKNVSMQIENYNFNVAISQMMIFINECYKYKSINKKYLESFLVVLSCFAPHIAEELWQSKLKHNQSIYFVSWPKYDESKLVLSLINIPIQENGKYRCVIEINPEWTEEEVISKVKLQPKVINFINNRQIKKIIYVKNKIVNIIV